MILIDTSVWIDFLREGPSRVPLARLHGTAEALQHPWVTAELALGHLGAKRRTILASLAVLPVAPLVPDMEVRVLIERRSLWGAGVGWVDAHLLASCLVAQARLWTFDARLAAAADRLGVQAKSP